MTTNRPKFKAGKMELPKVYKEVPGADCKNCPLFRRRMAKPETIFPMDANNPQPRIVLFGEGPGAQEVEAQEVFQGASGIIAREALESQGVLKYGVHLDNILLCDPRSIKSDSKDSKEETKLKNDLFKKAVKCCLGRVEKTIQSLKPELIIAMGNEAKEALTPEQKSGITKISGTIGKRKSIPVLYLYHPAWMLRNEAGERVFTQFRDHVNEARLFFEAKEFDFDNHVLTTQEQALESIKKLDGSDYITVDIETTSLSPWEDGTEVNPDLNTIQFAYLRKHDLIKESRAQRQYQRGELICLQMCGDGFNSYVFSEDIINDPIVISAIRDLLNTNRICYHNGQFDGTWMREKFGVTSDFSDDTMLKSYATDESPTHSLKRLARKYFGIEDWSSELSIWVNMEEATEEISFDNVPRPILYEYAGIDVVTTWRLNQRIKLNENEEALYRNFLIPISNRFVKMTSRGVLCDIKELASANGELETQLKKHQEFLLKEFGLENSNAPQQVIKVLEKLGVERPLDPQTGDPVGTNEKGWFGNLERRGNEEDFEPLEWKLSELSKNVKAARGLRKGIGTNLVDLSKSFSYRDMEIIDGKPYGIVHPDALIWSTVTGRVNYRRPTVTNYPVHTNYGNTVRRPLVARPGFQMLHYDWKQFELRTYGAVTGDPTMCDILNDSERDPHSEVGMACYGQEYWKMNERTNGGTRRDVKEIVFGRLYRRGTPAIAKQLERPIHEVQHIVDTVDSMFSMLAEYHEWIETMLMESGEIVNIIRRTRRFPMLNEDTLNRCLNQAVNVYIQSTASDLNLLSLNDAAEEFEDELFPFWTIHDSADSEVTNPLADKISDVISFVEKAPRKYLEAAKSRIPFRMRTDLTMKVDWKLTPHWVGD